ncbi:MAG: universal stress protein [Planctomyces sp.]|nr:universal stress protein [Planctomyces sp.]
MMSNYRLFPNRRVEDIFLPSDFLEGSETAFYHALKLALASKSLLTVLHVDPDASTNWQDFPGVRETLERWKLIPEGSPGNAIAKLGIDVRKIVAEGSDPVKACVRFLEVHSADLIVLSVHQRDGIMRWLGKSVAEPIAHAAKQMTLFIPKGVPGFVSSDDGSVTLKNILIPVATQPDPRPAVEAVLRLIESLDLQGGTVTLLQVSPPNNELPFDLPNDAAWKWNELVLNGEPAEMILQAADQINADLIVMTSEGPHGFLDGLRGSTTERVLRKAKCPVGSLPVGSLLG